VSKKPTKRPTGRPGFRPTDEQREIVRRAVAIGLTHEHVRQLVLKRDGRPISAPTLRKHFRQELSDGLWQANFTVANKLFSAALNGNITAQIFWLKNRAGWQDARQRGTDDAGPEPGATGDVKTYELPHNGRD
jgi:hypothetical protein